MGQVLGATREEQAKAQFRAFKRVEDGKDRSTKCPYCGRAVPAGRWKCPNCGRALSSTGYPPADLAIALGYPPLNNPVVEGIFARYAHAVLGERRTVCLSTTTATDLQGRITVNPEPLGDEYRIDLNLAAALGGLEHELGHERFTPLQVWELVNRKATGEEASSLGQDGRAILPHIFNILEDGRMERMLQSRDPYGYRLIEAEVALLLSASRPWERELSSLDRLSLAMLLESLPATHVPRVLEEEMAPAERKTWEYLRPLVREAVQGRAEQCAEIAERIAAELERGGWLAKEKALPVWLPVREARGAPTADGSAPGERAEASRGEGTDKGQIGTKEEPADGRDAPPIGDPEADTDGNAPSSRSSDRRKRGRTRKLGGTKDSLPSGWSDAFSESTWDSVSEAARQVDGSFRREAVREVRRQKKAFCRKVATQDQGEVLVLNPHSLQLERISVHRHVAQADLEWEKAYQDYRSVAQRLAAELRRLKSRVKQPRTLQRAGRLDRVRLVDVVKGSERVFRDTGGIGKGQSMAFSLVLDASGSMSPEEDRMRITATLMAEVLDELRVPFEITAFRDGPVQVIKAFHESFSRKMLGTYETYGGTKYTQALVRSSYALGSREERRRVMLFVTDGCPEEQAEKLAPLCEAIRKEGVIVAPVYLGAVPVYIREQMNAIFGSRHWVAIPDLRQLPEVLVSHLEPYIAE